MRLFEKYIEIKSVVVVLVILLSFVGCGSDEPSHGEAERREEVLEHIIKSEDLVMKKGVVLSTDVSFLCDSLGYGNRALFEYIIRTYHNDTCSTAAYSKKVLIAEFEGYYNIGDVNGDGIEDSVFVLEPLDGCEHHLGQAYYFSDSTLPRLISESTCCHPTNFFLAPDINEDGINEVGYYYSACSSRYKSLRIFTLRNGKWERIGASDFDMGTEGTEDAVFKDLIEKVSLNTFALKNFAEGEVFWDTILMK